MVKRSCEGTWKLSTRQPRSQCFSLLFYLLFFRDWNAVVQYHTIQCVLIFCNMYHRQPSVCFTEASRFFKVCFSNLFCFTSLLRKSSVCMDTVFYGFLWKSSFFWVERRRSTVHIEICQKWHVGLDGFRVFRMPFWNTRNQFVMQVLLVRFAYPRISSFCLASSETGVAVVICLTVLSLEFLVVNF